MSTPTRTWRNLRKIGIKNYLVQLWYMGDTKAGALIGTDNFGNKYFENTEELPLRTRWIEYAKHDFSPAHIEPLWHFWLHYGIDAPPNKDPLSKMERPWASPDLISGYTGTRGGFKTYSTTKSKLQAWEPVAAPRG